MSPNNLSLASLSSSDTPPWHAIFNSPATSNFRSSCLNLNSAFPKLLYLGPRLSLGHLTLKFVSLSLSESEPRGSIILVLPDLTCAFFGATMIWLPTFVPALTYLYAWPLSLDPWTRSSRTAPLGLKRSPQGLVGLCQPSCSGPGFPSNRQFLAGPRRHPTWPWPSKPSSGCVSFSICQILSCAVAHHHTVHATHSWRIWCRIPLSR